MISESFLLRGAHKEMFWLPPNVHRAASRQIDLPDSMICAGAQKNLYYVIILTKFLSLCGYNDSDSGVCRMMESVRGSEVGIYL